MRHAYLASRNKIPTSKGYDSIEPDLHLTIVFKAKIG